MQRYRPRQGSVKRRVGERLHSKSVIDALSCGILKPEKFLDCWSQAMAEVNATGMKQLYPGVCWERESITFTLSTRLSDTCCILAWACTPFVHQQGFSGPQKRTSGSGGPRFYYVMLNCLY